MIMRKRKNRKGGFLMFLGLLLIAAALFLTVRNILEQRHAEIAAGQVVSVLQEEISGHYDGDVRSEPVISVSGEKVEMPVSDAGTPVYIAEDGSESLWPVDAAGESLPAVQTVDGRWIPWPVDEDGKMVAEPCDAAGAAVEWPRDVFGTPVAWPVDAQGLPVRQFEDPQGNVFSWPDEAVGLDAQISSGHVVMMPVDSTGRIAFDETQAVGMGAWPTDGSGNILPWISGGKTVISWPTDALGRAISAVKAVLHRREILKAQMLESIPDYERYPDMEMPVTKIKGDYYIGVLDIPDQRISLPVMTDWSYSKLRVSPCRYSGSVYSGDIVIAGHNYWRHFSKIKRLTVGKSLSFTDVDGNVFNYVVSEIQLIKPTAVKEMKSGEWDLTLFTCTSSGTSRFAVRCTLVNSIPADKAS